MFYKLKFGLKISEKMDGVLKFLKTFCYFFASIENFEEVSFNLVLFYGLH